VKLSSSSILYLYYYVVCHDKFNIYIVKSYKDVEIRNFTILPEITKEELKHVNFSKVIVDYM